MALKYLELFSEISMNQLVYFNVASKIVIQILKQFSDAQEIKEFISEQIQKCISIIRSQDEIKIKMYDFITKTSSTLDKTKNEAKILNQHKKMIISRDPTFNIQNLDI